MICRCTTVIVGDNELACPNAKSLEELRNMPNKVSTAPSTVPVLMNHSDTIACAITPVSLVYALPSVFFFRLYLDLR